MRKTLRVAALMLALYCPALAGEMPTPPAPADGIIQGGQPSADGETPNNVDGEIPNDATGALTQIVLTVLASVLP